MRTSTSQAGFSLVELMMASMITVAVLGIAFTTFRDALALNDAVVNLTDSSQNLRAGTNLLVHDLLQAGRNIPTGGIGIPSGAGSSAIHRPSPPNRFYTFDNTTATTLSPITTGAALGPIVDGRPTDMVTILMDDPFLLPLEDVQPAGSVGSVPKLSGDGSSFNVGPQAAWLAGDSDNGIAPVKAGDLMVFTGNGGGSTIQTVTKVDTSTVYFEANDPFTLNQRGAAAGSITQLLGSAMRVRRVLMFTYFVYEETPGVPRLMRMLNQFPPQALAGVIEDLELSYDLADGVNNPANVKDLPYTAASVTYSASQIRKANIHVGVRSETKSAKMNDYLRNHLSTVISLRNLAYVDRYK